VRYDVYKRRYASKG